MLTKCNISSPKIPPQEQEVFSISSMTIQSTTLNWLKQSGFIIAHNKCRRQRGYRPCQFSSSMMSSGSRFFESLCSVILNIWSSYSSCFPSNSHNLKIKPRGKKKSKTRLLSSSLIENNFLLNALHYSSSHIGQICIINSHLSQLLPRI